MQRVITWAFPVLAGLSAAHAASAAAVNWTGLGDGVSWSDPANWSTNALPTASDDVTINVAANPTIIIASAQSVRSLTSAEELRVNTGGSIAVGAGGASCSASVRIAGGTIDGGAWAFSGGASFLVITIAEGRLNNPTISGDVILVDTSARIRVGISTTFTAMRFRNSSQDAAFEPGYVLNSQIIGEAAPSISYVELFGNGSFTIGPTGVITTAPGTTGAISVGQNFWYSTTTALNVQGVISSASTRATTVGPSSLTVASTGLIESTGTGGMTVGVRTAPLAWTNNGTIRASAGTITIEDTFTNAGSVQATAAGRVTISDSWSNAGTFTVSGNARLDLGGTFSTANIGTIVRGGGGTEGVIAITGTWTNTASTFNLNASTGSFLLNGATVNGGAITSSNGFGLRFGATSSSLQSVNYGGEVLLDINNANFRVRSGTTIGGIRVSASGIGVSFDPGYAINFPIIVDSSSTIGQIGFDTVGSGTLTFGPSASFTSIGAWTGTVSFGVGWWGTSSTEFINQGTIAVSGANRTLLIGGNAVTNSSGGTISASANTTLRVDVTGTNTNSWTNAGSIVASNTTLNFLDNWSVGPTGSVSVTNTVCSLEGRFSSPSLLRFVRSGGQINIQGRLDNTGQSVTLNDSTGTWRLHGGTIVGGSLGGIGSNHLSPTSAAGTIDSVNLTSELLIDDGGNARAIIIGASTLTSVRMTVPNAGVLLANGMVINYPIIADCPTFSSQSVEGATAGATLTIGPSGSIATSPSNRATLFVGETFWAPQNTATLINQGLISSSSDARELRIQPTSFVNSGTVRGRGGADVVVSGLTGNVSGFDIADAGTTLVLNGNYALTGTLNVGSGTTATLRGTWGNSGAINITGGTLSLDGTFSLATLGAFSNVGGTVSIIGTLNNAAGLTLNAATGSWTLAGGTINGGVINQTQGSTLLFSPNSEGTLNNVQITSPLVLTASSARVRLLGTTRATAYTLMGTSSDLIFDSGYTINETITGNAVGSAGVESVDGTLTFGPSSIVRTVTGSLAIGDFWLHNTRTVNMQGTVEAGSSGNITIAAAEFANYDAGTGTLTGGTWRMINGSSVNFGRPIRRCNATFFFDGNGQVPSSLVDVEENLGSMTFAGGRDAFIQTSTNSPTLFTNRGSINLGPGSTFTVGNTSHNANFTQAAAGSIRFDLAGTTLATHGSLRVHGTVTLDGTVNAGYVNGFQRQCGQVFQIIDANSRVGQFATRNVPPADDTTIFLTFYSGADVRFTVSARADFNEDGFLDIFDYDEFVACFEGISCPPGTTADFNDDGFVDIFDYDDFVFRFEAGCS